MRSLCKWLFFTNLSFHCATVRASAIKPENVADTALLLLVEFMIPKVTSFTKHVHIFALSQSSLKDKDHIKTKIMSSVGEPPQFATFTSFSAAILKLSTHAALGAAPQTANTASKVTSLGIQISVKQIEDCVVFTTRLKGMNFLFALRKKPLKADFRF